VLKLGSIVFEQGAGDEGLRDELTAQLAPG
jgi:hypothetical protein